MDIRKLILAKIKQKGKITSSEIVKETNFSRAYVNRFFQELEEQGQIIKMGETKGARYVLADKKTWESEKNKILEFNRVYENKNMSEDFVLSQIKQETGIFSSMKENVRKIVEYSFLEMLNNAIDHSKSSKINIRIFALLNANFIHFQIIDFGVGVFENIKVRKKLSSIEESIQNLMKGKLTTSPTAHTGQGIFFTSKLADSFFIAGNKKQLQFRNVLEDVFLKDTKINSGTVVDFSIFRDSNKKIEDVFREYTDQKSGDLEFSKTKYHVKLIQYGTEFLSRSEARRLMIGMDKFQEIILDYKDVETVGQSFADEINRVWQNNHPNIKISSINMSDNVKFMIERSL